MDPEPNDQLADDRRPAIIIYRAPLFNLSETFVRAHAQSLARYRPLIVGLEDKGNVPPELRDSLYLRSRFGPISGLVERLRRHRPQLVHAHFATDGLAALRLSRALGVPLVTTLHGYDITRSRGRMLASGRLSWMAYALGRERLMRAGDLFLPVSNALHDAALTQGFPAERTRTHYLGVDLARFFPAGERERGLILHVGRLVAKKGTSALIESMTRLTGSALAIIGDGPERGRLERQAAGLGERVRFLGALAPAEVGEWMRRASLLAAPSVTATDGDAEGLPTVIAEAAACGLPVVATRHSGIPEAVVHGATGFLVPENDPAALAERLALLLGSADLRERMGAAARKLAEEKFDLRRQTDRLEDIYDEMLGRTS